MERLYCLVHLFILNPALNLNMFVAIGELAKSGTASLTGVLRLILCAFLRRR